VTAQELQSLPKNYNLLLVWVRLRTSRQRGLARS
jgi:hypothetical protein